MRKSKITLLIKSLFNYRWQKEEQKYRRRTERGSWNKNMEMHTRRKKGSAREMHISQSLSCPSPNLNRQTDRNERVLSHYRRKKEKAASGLSTRKNPHLVVKLPLPVRSIQVTKTTILILSFKS